MTGQQAQAIVEAGKDAGLRISAWQIEARPGQWAVTFWDEPVEICSWVEDAEVRLEHERGPVEETLMVGVGDMAPWMSLMGREVL